MRLKRLVPLALTAVLAGSLALPAQAAGRSPRETGLLELPGRVASILLELLGFGSVSAPSEVGPGMDPIGSDVAVESEPTDDPQSLTPPPDEGEKGPGMDPIG
jgi:hypothetical protein